VRIQLPALLPALALALPALADDGPGRGGDDPPAPGRQDPVGQEHTSEPLRAEWVQEPGALAALERGLAFLAARQGETEDGSFPRTGHRDEKHAPVGVAALGALAFLAAGNAPDRGPYGREVGRAIDYLLGHVDLVPGSEEFGYVSSETDRTSRIHGHGFATLALSQAWVSSPRSPRGARIEEALAAAVRRIEMSQGDLGGWWYEPVALPNHEGSTTVCLLQALRAARDAGIHVDPNVVARAEDYLAETQSEGGRFAYMWGSDQFSVALTAAGIVTLNAAGRYESEKLDRALRALLFDLEERSAGRGETPDFPYYERLYVAQALWQLEDLGLFEEWARAERVRVLSDQRPDGSWVSTQYGDCYATAVNCLFLALPEGLLPIFQR
jgi:hypothetical protein